MLRRSLLYLSERETVRDVLLRLPLARRTARRFVAGESLEEALRVARELNDAGFHVTLDYLGESVTRAEEAERATRAYEASLDAIAEGPARATISLKLTQLGLEIDEALCAANLDRIVGRAAERENFVRIDMEGSRHTEATLRVFRDAFRSRPNVGCVIQSYLRRSEADVAELVRLRAPVRLCKGAYDEPPEVAFQHSSEVDEGFVRLARALLDGLSPGGGVEAAPGSGDVPRVALATHDEAMIRAARGHARDRGIPTSAYEFQMLYGVRRDYQARLVSEGHPMRIYVPYGSEWYAYLMRRMAERPANLWFVVRAMLGG